MDEDIPKKKPLVVGFPLYPNVTLIDFAGATQVFAKPFSNGNFEPIWLAADHSCIETSEGVEVLPKYTFDEPHPDIDILFVPGGGALGPRGGEEPGGVIGAMRDPDFLKFIRKTAAEAQWVGSICVGAFILAAAGLLKGSKATTYWSQLPNLKRLGEKLDFEVDVDRYPRWEFDKIDEDRHLFTGGGISSSIDLALQLTNIICCEKASQSSQLSIQYAPSPPFHAGSPPDAAYAGAHKEIVDGVRSRQEELFINPISAEVDRLLGKL